MSLRFRDVLNLPLRYCGLLSLLVFGTIWRLPALWTPMHALNVVPTQSGPEFPLSAGPSAFFPRESADQPGSNEPEELLMIDLALAWDRLPGPVRQAWMDWMTAGLNYRIRSGDALPREVYQPTLTFKALAGPRLTDTERQRLDRIEQMIERNPDGPIDFVVWTDRVGPAAVENHQPPLIWIGALFLCTCIVLRTWLLHRDKTNALQRLGF